MLWQHLTTNVFVYFLLLRVLEIWSCRLGTHWLNGEESQVLKETEHRPEKTRSLNDNGQSHPQMRNQLLILHEWWIMFSFCLVIKISSIISNSSQQVINSLPPLTLTWVWLNRHWHFHSNSNPYREENQMLRIQGFCSFFFSLGNMFLWLKTHMAHNMDPICLFLAGQR